ncbi:MAG: AAA family ATPase [Desulfobacteraceae bacterium]|nr:AAA family ATPase [Desulfobacteraceae bacterium]
MYNAFFGFREKPFKLVPNPEFLFLGKSHEEALAHLTYATTQGDGFVEITGEVGTGKTTLCRVFLESLGPNVEVAFIFNTRIDALGLLRAINNELGIDATAGTPTELIEHLNTFLVEKRAKGQSVILLIDEAQNLSVDTLEQLRMLSNLETTKNKLLQIILVGQPELGEILNSYALRQLGQRINLSCRLLPMTRQETRDYMDHRIKVASRRAAALFTRSAQNAIYDYSGGIPRLVNIACDRALVAAYSLNRPRVTRSLAKLAIKELTTRGRRHTGVRPARRTLITALIMVLAIALIALFQFSPARVTPRFPSLSPAGVAPPTVEAPLPFPVNIEPTVQEPTALAPPVKEIPTTIHTYLADHAGSATREAALCRVIALWNGTPAAPVPPLVREMPGDHDFFRLAAINEGLEVIRVQEDFPLVKTLNLPVIFPYLLPNQETKGYLAMIRITNGQTCVIVAGQSAKEFTVSQEALSPLLAKEAYIAYKERLGYNGIISRLSPRTAIINLKLLLRELGFPGIEITSKYDNPVQSAIKQVQADNGLTMDGLAGPITKIVLYNRKRSFSTPHLRNLD